MLSKQANIYARNLVAIIADFVEKCVSYESSCCCIRPERLQQRCDNRPDADSQCETCRRFRMECLGGFEQQRPSNIKKVRSSVTKKELTQGSSCHIPRMQQGY